MSRGARGVKRGRSLPPLAAVDSAFALVRLLMPGLWFLIGGGNGGVGLVISVTWAEVDAALATGRPEGPSRGFQSKVVDCWMRLSTGFVTGWGFLWWLSP